MDFTPPPAADASAALTERIRCTERDLRLAKVKFVGLQIPDEVGESPRFLQRLRSLLFRAISRFEPARP